MAEQIGEYNRRIEIWKRSGVVDAAGEPIPGDFILHKAKWSKIRGPSGMGMIRAQMDGAGVTAPVDMLSFRVNYDPSITVEMQVRHRGMIADISQVRHDEAEREWTDLVVKTGASDG